MLKIIPHFGYVWIYMGIYWIYMGRYISRFIPLSPIFRRGTELGDGRMMVGKESITSRNSSWKGSSRGPGARQKSAQKSMGLVEKCWKSPENLWGKPNFYRFHPVPADFPLKRRLEVLVWRLLKPLLQKIPLQFFIFFCKHPGYTTTIVP